ncbi:MAG TPA: S49 family peptidase [Gemmataceae bacterium]|jgi:protease-4|nr:S49 family peptidase [Gemmataceae bacterium]
MKRLLLTWLLVLAGCQHPIQVRTDSVVRVPDGVAGKVQMELPGHIDAGPMLEVAIASPGCAGAKVKVAVIDLDGVLCNLDYVGPYSQGENPLAVFKEKLALAAADPAVRAVVLRINSQGGGVAATDLMLHEIRAFKSKTGKPVVTCFLDLGAGGAYYLACGTDAIVASPTSVVGGIGVVLNLYYATVAMELQNIFDVSIKEGPSIDMGSPSRKLTDEERKLLTAMAKEYHERFKTIVVEGRKNVQRDSPFFDGRIMTAHEAKNVGLIDGEGYLEDALALARQLAGIAEAQPVMYRRKGDPARSLYAASANRPIHGTFMPYSIPGLDRSRLPLFLYMWQADPTLLKLTGQ